MPKGKLVPDDDARHVERLGKPIDLGVARELPCLGWIQQKWFASQTEF
jgi:hypothetical protein